MSVLIEAYSVVINKKAIDEKWFGGWNGFLSVVPNKTGCNDEKLVRFGFMIHEDRVLFVEKLEEGGLVKQEKDTEGDFVLADQNNGIECDTGWVESIFVVYENCKDDKFTFCRMIGDTRKIMAVPSGWKPEGSIAQENQKSYVNMNSPESGFEHVRRETNVDVYRNINTGKLVYVGRTE